MSTRGPKNTGGTTRDVEAALRVRKALQLRAQRLPWDEVAAKSGFSNRGAAHNAVMRELERNIASDVDELRKEELAFLDAMQAEIWPLFTNKKNKGRLFAADRLLTISERRCKILGLEMKPEAALGTQVIIEEVPIGYLEGPRE